MQGDLALDRGLRPGAVGMEVGRTVIPLDHGDAPAGLEQVAERGQCLVRLREVLQDEADETWSKDSV